MVKIFDYVFFFQAARYSARLSGYERGILTNRTKSTARTDDSNFALKDNLFLNMENEETVQNSVLETIKGKNELEKSTSAQAPHGSSLDALLKRTEEELRNLNLTNGLNITAGSGYSFDASLGNMDSHSNSSYEVP